METGDPMDLPSIVSYCNVCGYKRTHTLVMMKVDSCVFECDYCKQENNKENKEIENMKEKTINQDSEKNNNNSESRNENTSNMDSGVQKAADNKSIPDISDILPDGDMFSLPLLEKFLAGEKSKNGVLEETEIINGSYSDFARLKLDGEEYRSNSKTVIAQVKKLLELEMIPVKVCVAEKIGKSGRTYHTLRGGDKDQ
jgi:hypothetical protein